MINKIMPLLELTLKNKWKTHKPNSTIWAIPTLKDIDIGIIVWHFKYGKGIISSVTDQMFNINFFVPFNGKPNSNSKLMKINIVLKNKTIRIYKSHIKNQIEKKGYKPAYIKDLDQNDKIYHIARNSIGEIKNVNLIDKHINININNKTIKVPFSEFHKNQNILTSSKNSKKKEPDFDATKFNKISPTNNKIDNNYTIVNSIEELKVGDNVKTDWGIIGVVSKIEPKADVITIEVKNNRTVMLTSYAIDRRKMYKKINNKIKWEELTDADQLKRELKIKIKNKIYTIENVFLLYIKIKYNNNTHYKMIDEIIGDNIKMSYIQQTEWSMK